MGGEVLVAALVSGVLGDVVEVFAADDEGSVHLGGLLRDLLVRLVPGGLSDYGCGWGTYDDLAGQDTATDGDETGEWALLVDVAALNGRLWRAKAKTDILLCVSP